MNFVKNDTYIAICLIAFLSMLLFLSFTKANAASPPIPEASIFLNEIDKNNYRINKNAHSVELFEWDFSNTNHYVYSYLKKSVENDFSILFGVELGRSSTETILNAELIINSLGNRTADLVLKDIKTAVSFGSDVKKEKHNKRKISNIPSIVIASIDENGQKDSIKGNNDLLMSLLFSIPNKPLELNGKATMIKSIPIAINDKIFTAVGELIITLTDYVIINGRDCARFEAIADLKKTNAQNGNSEYAIKTNSIYYFDIYRRCIIIGGSAVLHSIRYEDTATRQKIINDNHSLLLLKLEAVGE